MERWLHKLSQSSVDIIGFPCSLGQGRVGVEKGPTAMRTHGIVEQLKEINIPVKDLGDIEVVDFQESDIVQNIKKPRGVGEANKKLSLAVCASVKQGHMTVVLGGDHSMGIGTVYGQCQASPGMKLVWVDAHADVNSPKSSTSANAHGMPVCFLAKELKHLIPEKLPGFEWLTPCLSTKDIVYIGLRDVDQAEKFLLKEHNIMSFTSIQVARLGIDEVMKQTMEYLKPSKLHPIHISFDIDALDPSFAPSTGTPVIGGLSLREGMSIVETIASTGFLEVLDIAEVNPNLGTEAQKLATLSSANEIVASAFGRRNNIPFLE